MLRRRWIREVIQQTICQRYENKRSGLDQDSLFCVSELDELTAGRPMRLPCGAVTNVLRNNVRLGLLSGN